jgi:hypothetical protein
MAVKTWNRVSSMQLRGLYEVMVGKALGKKNIRQRGARKAAGGGRMKYKG